MKLPQIIAIVVAISLIAILYNLPKVIINKEDKNKLAIEADKSASRDNFKGIGASSTPKRSSSKIEKLRKNFYNVGDVEKRCNFADSLANAFIELENFDSSAWYAERLVLLNSELKAKATAADIYYKLYTLAAEPTVANLFATKAQQYYKEILQNDPSNTAAKINLAMTYVTSENPMQAIGILREVLDKEPNNESAIFNLGLLSLQSGQHQKAEARFRKLVELNNRNWKAHLYLGVALGELGNTADAQKELQMVVKNAKDPSLVAEAKELLGQKN